LTRANLMPTVVGRAAGAMQAPEDEKEYEKEYEAFAARKVADEKEHETYMKEHEEEMRLAHEPKFEPALLAEMVDTCTSWDSLIVLEDTPRLEQWYTSSHTKQAGLLDRLSVLMGVACLASTLCARVVVGSPCSMLNATANDGVPLDCEVGWSRYAAIGTADGMPLLLDGIGRDSSSSSATRVPIAYDRRMIEEHRQALAAAKAGKPFVWPLSWHDDVVGHGAFPVWSDDVTTVSKLMSNLTARAPVATYGDGLTRQLRDSLLNAHGLSEGGYYTLHVRRGDALAECDTSTPTVLAYVECQLRNEGAFSSDKPMLVFTDELDQGYLRSLLDGVSHLFGGARTVLHGDALLRQLYSAALPSAAADNFVVFNAAVWLMETSASALEIRDKTHSGTGMCSGQCTLLDDADERVPPVVNSQRRDWGCGGAY